MSKFIYSLLKGRVARAMPFSSNPHQRPHYHMLIEAAGKKYDVAVNIASEPKRVHGGKVVHEDIHVLYAVKAAVLADRIGPLGDVREGVLNLPADSPLRLDYLADSLVKRDDMKRLPLYNAATPAHPDDILRLIDRAVKNNRAYAYAFGHRYDHTQPTNAAWHFAPDDGVHNIQHEPGQQARRPRRRKRPARGRCPVDPFPGHQRVGRRVCGVPDAIVGQRAGRVSHG